MSVLQNPVIPIVVRWSASEASLRVENRRREDSVRPDRLERVNHACAILGTLAWPMLERLRNCPMNNAEARQVAEHLQRIADGVTRETDVLFAVSMETDEGQAPPLVVTPSPAPPRGRPTRRRRTARA